MSAARARKILKLQRNLHWAGSGLGLLGIAFVGFRIRDYSASHDFSQITVTEWAAMLGLALLYGLASLMLALAWRNLLGGLGAKVTRQWSIKTYGVSQLAKYVPGNIFHLAGRQVMGMGAGVPAGALAKSAIWELGLIAIAGTIYGWLVLPLLAPGFPPLAGVVLLLGAMLGIAYLLRRAISSHVAAAFGWQVLFLAVSGGIFVAVTGLLAGSSELKTQTWLPLGGAYVVAWLAGLVTPGAPAGAGVRELVLLLLLRRMVAEADLLMAIFLGRIITVAGDCLFFIAASRLPIEVSAHD
jgi:hypothetical protein